ncbi:hypothetical protein QYE76_013416 [Lolium multiflorum]|uniref:Uncharacterized protein n=1 Tax=Lolium multiflorum TaxID=4521 RepID=A0AAD8U3W9_LOLMU|nr:hypothetical protein QYE76_013416 [Lolium multiflorum]
MENYSLFMGAAAVMKMAVEMAVSMEKPSGHFPVRRCRNRDSCPPDLGFAMAAGRFRVPWLLPQVPVFPMPREGRERSDKEFDARRRARYLGDIDYIDRELSAEDNDDNEGEYDDVVEDGDAAESEYEASSDGHVQGGDNSHDDGGPTWDPETQPPDINRELDQLAMWYDLAI